MNWGSAGEFFAMGGYAYYVWGSYGVAALVIAAEIGLVWLRRRRAAGSIARGAHRNSGAT